MQSLVDDRWRPVTTGVFGLVIGGDENEKDMKKMQNWLVLVCGNSTNLSTRR